MRILRVVARTTLTDAEVAVTDEWRQGWHGIAPEHLHRPKRLGAVSLLPL